jgi:sugar phosphate permease
LLRLVLTVFAPFAGGYFLSYLFRSVNAVIAPQLIRDVGLSAADLGLLTAAYFLAFAAFQLPLGVLLDRFGPRRVQAGLLLMAALGALVFALGENRPMLIAGRALIGLGVAGGLMASFKAITLWFPNERWPLVNGCFLAMGGLGAMAATQPIEMLLHITDWRGIFVGLSLATCCASAVIFLVVPETDVGVRRTRLVEQVAALRTIYGARLFWRLAPMSIACVAASFSIQGLWAGPWLEDVAGFDSAGKANYLLMLAAAMTVGMIVTGLAADLLGRLGVGLASVMGGGIAVFLVAQVAIVLELDPTGVWPWVLFGLTANTMTLAYPQLCRQFPLDYAGRVNTGLNVLVFAGAFIAQSAMGAIIDLWPPAPGGGFLPVAYQAAFGATLAIEGAAFAWFLVAGRRPT